MKTKETKPVMENKPKVKKGGRHPAKKLEARNMLEGLTLAELEQQKFGETNEKKLEVIDIYIKKINGGVVPDVKPDDEDDDDDFIPEDDMLPEIPESITI